MWDNFRDIDRIVLVNPHEEENRMLRGLVWILVILHMIRAIF